MLTDLRLIISCFMDSFHLLPLSHLCLYKLKICRFIFLCFFLCFFFNGKRGGEKRAQTWEHMMILLSCAKLYWIRWQRTWISRCSSPSNLTTVSKQWLFLWNAKKPHSASQVRWFVWAFTITWRQVCLPNILCTLWQHLPSLPNKRIDSTEFASLMLCVSCDTDTVFSCFRPLREASFFPSSIYPLMLEVWSPRL